MTIWSAEINDLEKLYDSFKGSYPKLDRELEKLIKTDDENMVLVYARRSLEVIITDLFERELKRSRGTEPLKGIIDKLNREGKVPENIITSMQSLNSMSTFGAHPKDFDPRQVKPVILDLTTVIEWYTEYSEIPDTIEVSPELIMDERKIHVGHREKTSKLRKKIMLISGILMVCAIVVICLAVFGIIKVGKQVQARSIESVVVLPFSNYTGADELETMVAGMHACLISDIGRLSGLRVINATTSNVYKNASKSIKEIANELNVDAAIEVSVLGIIDSILIQVSLISVFPEEETLWNADYKEEKSQILNLYNRITRQIADKVNVELTSAEERSLAKSRTVDPEALVAYMKGQFHWERLGNEDMDSALHYFQMAIDKDPGWADPYAGMAMTWEILGRYAYAPLADAYKKASEYLKKALELDPNSANSHYVQASTLVWHEWDWENGEKEFIKTLELNPNDALCRIYYSHLLMILRRSDEAIYQANLALSLDPLRPLVLGLYAIVFIDAGDYKSAITQAQKALSIDPDNNYANDVLARAYLGTGDTLKWYERMKQHWYWADDKYLSYLDTVFQKGGYLAVIKDRIKVNEDVYSKGISISYTGQANRYLIIGNYDKAMYFYEKAYEEQFGQLAYVSLVVIEHPELRDNARYVALLKKMNLPLK
jgi:TolB-like protein